MGGAEEEPLLVGVVVVNVGCLVAALETRRDGVLGDVVVGVLARHGRRNGEGAWS